MAHRKLGVYVSFVRSMTDDTWNEKQLKCMTNGGNGETRQLFEQYDLFSLPIDQRYLANVALWN